MPYSSRVGPNIITPMPPMGLRAPIRFISCCSTRASADVSPPPPYSFGQVGVPQPLAPIRCFQSLASPAGSSTVMIRSTPFIEGGKFSSSQARASARNVSTSPPKSGIWFPPENRVCFG